MVVLVVALVVLVVALVVLVGGLPDEKTDIYLCTKNLAARFITILAPSALFFFCKKGFD